MTSSSGHSQLKVVGVAFAASACAAAIWTVLAWRTPTSTFHFAPIIAGGVGPYVAATLAGRQPLRLALQIVAGSALAVGTAVVVLVAGDRLQGPTFWSDDGALTEAVLFAAFGLVAGLLSVSSRRRPRTEHESRPQEAQQTT